MTETLRFSQIGKEDLKIGTGNFEVRLGDGRVVTLSEIRLTDFLSALTTGSVLFVKAGGVAGEDNANLFWDDTNNRLGIGTASPSQPLHVVGIIRTDANLTWRSGTSFLGTLDHANTVDRIYTFPDSDLTIVGLATTQTLTGKTLLASSSGNVVSGILDRDVTTNDVVNTVTETTVYTFSVPGGTLSTNRALRLTLIGDYLNNSGVNSRLEFLRVKYGGTEAALFDISAIPTNADRRMLRVDAILSANNATNAQVASTIMYLGAAASADGNQSTETFGTLITHISAVNHNAIAIDSTSAQTMVVTFQHGAANANISARALAVQLEVLV